MTTIQSIKIIFTIVLSSFNVLLYATPTTINDAFVKNKCELFSNSSPLFSEIGINSYSLGEKRPCFVRIKVAKSTTTALQIFYSSANGFIGTTFSEFLHTGTIIDRYGRSAFSSFFSPAGTPAAARESPPGTTGQALGALLVFNWQSYLEEHQGVGLMLGAVSLFIAPELRLAKAEKSGVKLTGVIEQHHLLPKTKQ